MKPIDDAIDRYEENPPLALMVIAIRRGFWLEPKWEAKALRILRQTRNEMREWVPS